MCLVGGKKGCFLRDWTALVMPRGFYRLRFLSTLCTQYHIHLYSSCLSTVFFNCSQCQYNVSFRIFPLYDTRHSVQNSLFFSLFFCLTGKVLFNFIFFPSHSRHDDRARQRARRFVLPST